jgi:trans-aconitate methyltransferase
MNPMNAADFEARYRADIDPWGYTHSPYEQAKYEATLEACGAGPFASALELAGSIGVFSEMLAPRCRQLATVDVAPTAVQAARARLAPHPQAEVILGAIPEAIPDRSYDLVVASEILYYLPDPALTGTLALLELTMLPGARLVAVHWRPPGPERPRDAAAAHALLQAQPWLAPLGSAGTEEYRLDVLVRR